MSLSIHDFIILISARIKMTQNSWKELIGWDRINISMQTLKLEDKNVQKKESKILERISIPLYLSFALIYIYCTQGLWCFQNNMLLTGSGR